LQYIFADHFWSPVIYCKSNINKIKVLIELQPSFNDKSRAAFDQIIYEFSNKPLYKIKIMNASYKNLISLNKNLTHSKFIQKYSAFNEF
jgi:hypothetical protein